VIPEALSHYKAYKPRPFRREERDATTILFGGLTWKHERLIQGVFHNLHYRAEPLPNVSRVDLDTGKELTDVGACCPTTFVTGNLVSFLRSKVKEFGKERVVDKYMYLTAGACGACRFGQYHQSYTMALDTLGLKDFRIFLLAQDDLDQGAKSGGGLELNMPFTMGLVWAILCADLLTDLEYMTRPYEVLPGQTDRVLHESIEELYQVFRERPMRGKRWSPFAWHLATGYFTQALRRVMKKWDVIAVDRLRVKPKVQITGEFWLQTHEGDGNYNIKKWLEAEGAEVVAPPIAVWFDYWIRFYVQEFEARRGVDRYASYKIRALEALQWLFHSAYDRLRKSLGYLPRELPDQYELQKLAAPYFHNRLSGGEGDMLIGKALHAYHHKTAHMVCELTPYSCLPNTMSIGAMSQVLGVYPDLLYAPIEIKGDAEAHALSRCQMILTEAKKRAQREFENVLAERKVSVEQLRRLESTHPAVTKLGYRFPSKGQAGTSAAYALALASNMELAS
jgi:predicted nucleotide-binding protein (sugar kinase/HSP70/actin superfamily)